MEASEAVGKASQIVEAAQSGELENVFAQILKLGIEAGKNIILALIIYIVGRFLISILNKLAVGMMERKKLDTSIQTFLKSFINITLTVLLLITVVSALGVNTTSFAALLASAGVAVGMALSGNLQNLAGGIIIILFKPYKVGDYVDAQGVSGTVKEIQIFHTILQTADQKTIYVPNGALSSGSVVNYSTSELRRVEWTVGVEYGTGTEKVAQTLQYIASTDARIMQSPAPFVALSKLNASSVDFILRAWVKNADYWDVFFDINKQIYNVFGKEGIEFPFPQVVVHKA